MSTTSEVTTSGLGIRAPSIGLVLQVGVIVVAFIGMGVAAYLSFVHFAGLPVYCEGSGGCETVQSSEYAELMGIPVAFLGFILYTAIFAAGIVMVRDIDQAAEIAPFLVFGLALSGVIYSGYLTWLELYEIHAICRWCVVSASLMGVLFLLATAEIAISGRWRGEEFEDE